MNGTAARTAGQSVPPVRRPRHSLRAALRPSARPAQEPARADPFARSVVHSDVPRGESGVRPARRQRRISYFYARRNGAGSDRLVFDLQPPCYAVFYRFLAGRDLSRTVAVPEVQNFSRIFTKKCKKSLFKNEKIGYNKETEKTRSAKESIWRPCRCACANRHSLPSSSYWR